VQQRRGAGEAESGERADVAAAAVAADQVLRAPLALSRGDRDTVHIGPDRGDLVPAQHPDAFGVLREDAFELGLPDVRARPVLVGDDLEEVREVAAGAAVVAGEVLRAVDVGLGELVTQATSPERFGRQRAETTRLRLFGRRQEPFQDQRFGTGQPELRREEQAHRARAHDDHIRIHAFSLTC
jgi:hypothetical protein